MEQAHPYGDKFTGKSLSSKLPLLSTVSLNEEGGSGVLLTTTQINIHTNSPVNTNLNKQDEGGVNMHEKPQTVKELGEGESKYARETEGEPSKCARELGALVNTCEAPKGTHVVELSHDVSLPTKFNIGTGGRIGKKTKKVGKKTLSDPPVNVTNDAHRLYAYKRKNMCIESEVDGEDIRMVDIESREKKTKLNGDIIDGNISSLTVAEVGMSQPREGQ